MTSEDGFDAPSVMRDKRGRRDGGFSLLECMASLIVACLGMLALAKLQVHLRAESDAARQQLEASHLAQQKLEDLRSLPYAALADGAEPDIAAANTRYRRWWSTQPAPHGTGFQQVTVNLAWNDRAGRLHTLALTTLIAQKDPMDVARLALSASAQGDTGPDASHRHPDVPLLAVDRRDGTSVLTVGATISFYDNLSGALLSICALPALTAASSPTLTMCADLDAAVTDTANTPSPSPAR